jgi:hypothetical protein
MQMALCQLKPANGNGPAQVGVAKRGSSFKELICEIEAIGPDNEHPGIAEVGFLIARAELDSVDKLRLSMYFYGKTGMFPSGFRITCLCAFGEEEAFGFCLDDAVRLHAY